MLPTVDSHRIVFSIFSYWQLSFLYINGKSQQSSSLVFKNSLKLSNFSNFILETSNLEVSHFKILLMVRNSHRINF